ncbi:apolipoprotein A-II-like [Platysternon megacephalum]|uniref:Apolipoprotein A-II-like n=1 Tax=Platysternon megacephalum TaxID=55544 RepID=A0A4D9DXW3_9SAUR|nr:apolipoprotein A-II-like [Platysternon megacephalum]
MVLSQRSLRIVTFLVIFFLACFATSQETENKRAVAEHQFMQDKGRALQGLKRLMWLHNAMGSVHTARARDASHSNSLWDSQKSQDLPDLYDSTSKDESPNLVKQLLLELTEKEQAFPVLKKTDLRQYLKNPKGSWSLQDLFDLFQREDWMAQLRLEYERLKPLFQDQPRLATIKSHVTFNNLCEMN